MLWSSFLSETVYAKTILVHTVNRMRRIMSNCKQDMNKNSIISFIVLQIALFIASVGAVCSKMAGRQPFLSLKFIAFYGLLLVILFVYSIVWQQVLKNLPLTVAYASKGVGILYGMMWGMLIFKEIITWNMVVGAVLVLMGVYIYIFSEIKEEDG